MKIFLSLSLALNIALFAALFHDKLPWFNKQETLRPPEFIGSEIATISGGASYYPKAQSFIAPSDEITRVSVKMRSGCARPWRVKIISSLPLKGGKRGLLNQMDLNRKTLGYAQVHTSNPGWVDFEFLPPLKVQKGRTYYLFMDSSDLGVLGPDAEWLSSPSGPQPGFYPDGEGWVFVYSWSNKSNFKEIFEKHTDYAFRIYR